MKEDDTYFYDFVKRRVVALDTAFRLIDEAKVEEKSFKQGEAEWRKSAKEDRFLKKSFKRKESVIPRTDLSAGAETKKKARYPSKGLTCWGCGADHHRGCGADHHRGDCQEIIDEEKAKIIEC